MAKFQVGKSYWTRSVCDYDCIITIEILSRTQKTVRGIVNREEKTLRVKEWDGIEQVMPWGRYSMAPMIGADRLAP